MEFDFETLDAPSRYKLLSQVVVPRPIALVTAVDRAGRVNAAPYSFFNVMSQAPPLVVIGIENRPDGTPKDTAQFPRESGEFVVNMVDFAIAGAMNVCAVDFPPGENELQAAGLTAVASTKVTAPRIAEAPVSLECRKFALVEIGPRGRSILVGEVVHLHVRDDAVTDPVRLHVDPGRLDIVGRLGGFGYVRTTERFDMKRISYAEWVARTG
ncbi:MAG: flavin reductase family protein [Alphaproteobacteria bacterium]|nr:flavin reductase family protein [Alphaproteobacteria bacterium]